MIKYFIQKALGKKTFRKPRISVCVPSGVTEVEKKAVEDATYQAGAVRYLLLRSRSQQPSEQELIFQDHAVT